MINSLNKADDFIKMINLLSKTDDFIKSEKIKAFPLVCSKCLSSWTSLGRSGHVRFPTFARFLHVLISKFCRKEQTKTTPLVIPCLGPRGPFEGLYYF